MRLWTKLGAVSVLVGCATVGCSAAPPSIGADGAPAKPSPTVRATSSAITKKLSGVTRWRVYEGNTSLVVLGFGKDKKPVDGLRFRFASTKKRKWAVSLEMVKGMGAIQIDARGNVVRNTMTDAEIGVMFGATRVLEAWRKSGSGSTRAVAYSGEAAATCASGAREVLKDCGPVVTKCVGAAGRAALRGSRGGVQTGALFGAAILGRCAWQNRGAVYKCGKSAWDNGKECYDKATEKDEEEEKKNPPPEDKEPKEKEPETTPEGEEAGAPSAETPEGEPVAEEPEGETPPDETKPADDGENPELQPTEEEQKEDEQQALEDPENAPPQESVEEEPPPAEDDVEPNPPEAQEEEPVAEEPSEEAPPVADESVPVASLAASPVSVAARAAGSSARRGGACRASAVLVCGGAKKMSYCRCVRP